MNDIDPELAHLLAKAGILMFEYDRDGFLIAASGSCLGTAVPDLELRAGLLSAASVRRATKGEAFVECVRVTQRTIAVRHQPVRDHDGRVERVLVTAFDVSEALAARDVSRWSAALAAAS
jgi:hypothetical protein